MPRRKKSPQTPPIHWYVLYGFNKEDIDKVGYFGYDNMIVTDLSAARRFPDQNINNQSGFGTPLQWKELINADDEVNHGYKFHLVKTTLSS